MNDPRNVDAKAELEDGEFIEIHVVKIVELYKKLNGTSQSLLECLAYNVRFP